MYKKNSPPKSSQAYIQALFSQAIALHQKGQLKEAQVIYEEILRSNPKYVDALHLLGVLSSQLTNHQLAADLIGKAIAISPNNAAFYSNRGIALHQLSQFDAAVASYAHAIRIKPDYAEAYYNRGLALYELTQFKAAVASYYVVTSLNPQHAGAFANCGNALQELEEFEAAVTSYNKAICITPDVAAIYFSRGNAHKELKQFGQAVDSYVQAIKLNQYDAASHYNLGLTLQVLDKYEAAVSSYNKAISINSNLAEAYANRGAAQHKLKHLNAALDSFDQAINIKSDYAAAYSNRGITLQELGQLDLAMKSYDRAITIKPEYAEAYYNRGNAQKELNQLEAALASFDQSIRIKPDYAEAYFNRGATLDALKQLAAAADSYTSAMCINPNLDYLHGTLLHSKMKLCNWVGYDLALGELINKIDSNNKSSPSFVVLALTSSLPTQLKATKVFTADKYPANLSLGNIAKLIRKNKIRIAYYSAEFHNHATTYLMAELFERHDRNKFELFAFSFGPESSDDMRQRVSAAFDQFIDVRQKNNKEIAELSRLLYIDIAIDLKGHTFGQRLGIFSYRAAPIQVHYIGYPGTLGTEYIDYLIADKVLIPEEYKKYYSEKIIYLPNSYQVNDRKRIISDRKFTRSEFGLPNSGFIYCCFNNNYKITPEVLDSWINILNAVEGSILWLLEDNQVAAENLKKEARNRGLDSRRLVFANRLNLPEHLARHRLADLFLDTQPCNAHTTASDSLWAGLPVLTCTGESFASRVAASLLNAIGLPELVTHSQEEYETLAIKLGNNPEQNNLIKDKLQANRLTTPLFDTDLLAKHIESAFTQIYERYQNDEPPETLYIV